MPCQIALMKLGLVALFGLVALGFRVEDDEEVISPDASTKTTAETEELQQPETLRELQTKVTAVCSGGSHAIVNCADLEDATACCQQKYCGYADDSCHFLKDLISSDRTNTCPRTNMVQYGILPARKASLESDIADAAVEMHSVFSVAPKDNFVVAVYDTVKERDRSEDGVQGKVVQPTQERIDPGVFATSVSQALPKTHKGQKKIHWRLYRTIRVGENIKGLISWVNEKASDIHGAGGVLESVVIAGNGFVRKACESFKTSGSCSAGLCDWTGSVCQGMRTESIIKEVANAGVVQVGTFSDPLRTGEVARVMTRFACGASFLTSQIALDKDYAAKARAISPHMYISTTFVRSARLLSFLPRLGIRWNEDDPPPVAQEGVRTPAQAWTDATKFLKEKILSRVLPGPVAFEVMARSQADRLKEIAAFFDLIRT